MHISTIVPKGLSPGAVVADIYLFHGSNGDDLQPFQMGLFSREQERIVELALNKKIRFIVPDIDASFLTRGFRADAQNYRRYFLEEVLHRFSRSKEWGEKKIFLAGYSAGGRAALSLFLDQNIQVQGLAALAPTLIDFDLFSDVQLQNFAKNENVSSPYLDVLKSDFESIYRDSDDFSKEDPFRQLESLTREQLAALKGKMVFLSVGELDEFGLKRGTDHFSIIWEAKLGSALTSEIVKDGKHDPAYLLDAFPRAIESLVCGK
jgi:dienelactone hydrolase